MVITQIGERFTKMFVVNFSVEGTQLGGRGEGGLYSFCVCNLWLEKDRYIYLSKKKKILGN